MDDVVDWDTYEGRPSTAMELDDLDTDDEAAGPVAGSDAPGSEAAPASAVDREPESDVDPEAWFPEWRLG